MTPAAWHAIRLPNSIHIVSTVDPWGCTIYDHTPTARDAVHRLKADAQTTIRLCDEWLTADDPH